MRQPLTAVRPKTIWVMRFSRTKSEAACATLFPLTIKTWASRLRGELEVGGQGALVFVALTFCFDMQDEELSTDSLGDASAARDEQLRSAVGADADSDALADGPVRLDAFGIHVCGEGAIDGLGDVLQGELAECDEVAAAEEVGKGFFRAVYAVDVAASHAGLQGFRGEVGHDDLVGTLDEPVGHDLADLDSGDALHGGGDAFDVLDVHGGEHVDVGGEDVEHVLVALGVKAAFDVGVG